MLKINLIILSVNGFPFGYAYVEKMKLIAKIVKEDDGNVTILNRKPILAQTDYNKNIKSRGTYLNIDYIYCSGTAFKPLSFIKYKLLSILGFVNEFVYLFRLRDKSKKNILLFSYTRVTTVFYYRLISWLFNYELVLSVMELHISLKQKSVFNRLNAYLFDNYVYYFIDKVIPISIALSNFIKARKANLREFILPAITDFRKFIPQPVLNSEPYLLYCGNVGYFDIINFLIQIHSKLIKDAPIKLVLVIHGSAKLKQKVFEIVAKLNLSESIKIQTDLTEDELSIIYANALCLLIPLQNKLQDNYRFPQKIAEYVASGRPIITTNIGVIKDYFKDGETAYVADDYSIDSYCNKIKEALSTKYKHDSIVSNAYKLGIEYFDYRSYLLTFNNFLKT